MLVIPESSSAVLVMISRSLSICNRSRAGRVNSGEIMIFRGYSCLMSSFEGNLLTQLHEICAQETIYSTLSHGRNPGLYLTWA